MAASKHYVKYGVRMLRNPSAAFDTAYYLRTNPDVVSSGINPLVHYLLYGKAEGREPRKTASERLAKAKVTVDIVIPVYNALDDVKLCLAAVNEQRDDFVVHAYVVNDGSNAETTDWLRAYCNNNPLFSLIEHSENRGYTSAVNTGLAATSGYYAITLNSDTIVTNGWLKCLIRCAQSDPKIGIVGPLSNAASWQNVPFLYDETGNFAVNELPSGLSPNEMATIVASVSRRTYPRVPFVNGFCFLIKREVIDSVGFMDEVNFPIGYGEENDFCIRAADAGFTLAIADDAYVFHAKSKSFGHGKRKELSRLGGEALRRKHTEPKFSALVDQIKNTDSLDAVRALILNKLKFGDMPAKVFDPIATRILFLLPVRGGGGGAHSVVQEAAEMRRLGVDAKIAVKQEQHSSFLDLYGDVACAAELFCPFTPTSLWKIAESYDVVIATIFTSVTLLKQICDANPHILPAYYVQDYEPLFFEEGTQYWAVARESYELIPNALLFAKTHWIADKVKVEHGVNVEKVRPSIDHDVYKPRRKRDDRRISIGAMIRPQTPRRGAERTMRVLSRLAEKYSDQLEFHLFGCEDAAPEFENLERNFKYVNHGVLKRAAVANLLGECDIFLDFSDYQAFGRTALEAMACGCAVVVTKHGGTDEYAVDGVNSFTVDSFNEIECYDRLSSLVSEPYLMADMQRAALSTAANYSVHSAAVSELVKFAEALPKHRLINSYIEKKRVTVISSRNADSFSDSAFTRAILPLENASMRKHYNVEICNVEAGLPAPRGADLAFILGGLNDIPSDELATWLSAWKEAGARLVWDNATVASELRSIENEAQKLINERHSLLLNNADAVIASNSEECAVANEKGKKCYVIENWLDSDLWGVGRKRDHNNSLYGRVAGAPLRIGYFGGADDLPHLAQIAGALKRIEKDFGDRVVVEIIGTFQDRKPLFGKKVGLPKKRDYPNFVKWLQQRVHWDIGILPFDGVSVATDEPALKFLQYATLDMAVVCSSTVHSPVIESGKSALVVENNEDNWYDAIATLLREPSYREQLASHAFERTQAQVLRLQEAAFETLSTVFK